MIYYWSIIIKYHSWSLFKNLKKFSCTLRFIMKLYGYVWYTDQYQSFHIKCFCPLSSMGAMSRKKQQNVLHYKSKSPTKENKLCILFHLLRQLELYQSNLIHIINYKAFIKHLKEALFTLHPRITKPSVYRLLRFFIIIMFKLD